MAAGGELLLSHSESKIGDHIGTSEILKALNIEASSSGMWQCDLSVGHDNNDNMVCVGPGETAE